MPRCIRCKEEKFPDDMQVVKRKKPATGHYVSSVCRECESKRRLDGKARRREGRRRPVRLDEPMNSNPVRSPGWHPPPRRWELRDWHASIQGLNTKPRWGIVNVIVTDEED